MAKLKAGDRIDCRIKQGIIVSPYKDYDEIRTFEVIAKDKHGYYLFVPDYYGLKDTYIADKYLCSQVGMDKRFIGDNIIYIQGNMVCRISSLLDGVHCAHCHEFYAMAEPNQEDGTLICYSCRTNPYR